MEVLADVNVIHHSDNPAASRARMKFSVKFEPFGVGSTISNSVFPHLMQVDVAIVQRLLSPVLFRKVSLVGQRGSVPVPSEGAAHFYCRMRTASNVVCFEGASMPFQKDWKWCNQCQVLCFSGRGLGACKANPGGGHNFDGSGNYVLYHYDPPPFFGSATTRAVQLAVVQ